LGNTILGQTSIIYSQNTPTSYKPQLIVTYTLPSVGYSQVMVY
jgi:hypothetical protein